MRRKMVQTRIQNKPFFTADTHAGHANIIKYCNRPFKTAEEMAATIVDNWNSVVVSDDDVVYHMGDVWDVRGHNPGLYKEFLGALNGKIYLVLGNHDQKVYRFKDRFELWPKDMGGNRLWYKDLATIRVPDVDHPEGHQTIVLAHFAQRVWNASHYGAWHLYGHSHGMLPDDPHAYSMDVGMDCHGFKPVTYEEVQLHMFQKKEVPLLK
jgi:calcineurin-like phosphoesterase family protein